MANEGWETFLSYEDTRQVILPFFPQIILLVPTPCVYRHFVLLRVPTCEPSW
jgi:hypothetical protein